VREGLAAAGYIVIGPPEPGPQEAAAPPQYVQITSEEEAEARRLRNVPAETWQRLMGYQREGVIYALRRQVRAGVCFVCCAGVCHVCAVLGSVCCVCCILLRCVVDVSEALLPVF